VIVAVPVSSLRAVLQRIGPLLRPGTLVVDVCAVKVEPVRWMKRMLPAEADILATHPLFGPDSAARSLKGKTVVLCPVRLSRTRLRAATALLKKAGLTTMVLTPQEHDSLMAETIFLTQFLGRLLATSSLRRRPPVTSNYAGILALVDTVRNDTPQLFADMVAYSRETRRVMRCLNRAFAGIQRLRRPGRR
jgi:prephenate dehydrogenase